MLFTTVYFFAIKRISRFIYNSSMLKLKMETSEQRRCSLCQEKHREAVELLSSPSKFVEKLGFDLVEHLKNCSDFAKHLHKEAPVIQKRNRDVGKLYSLFTL